MTPDPDEPEVPTPEDIERVTCNEPDEPDSDEQAEDAPPPADSAAALRDAVEADEDEDISEGEGKDRFGIA